MFGANLNRLKCFGFKVGKLQCFFGLLYQWNICQVV
jgi:hypothetical protein